MLMFLFHRYIIADLLPLYHLSSGCLRGLKSKENFKLLALKVVEVAYDRWSLTRLEVQNKGIWFGNVWYFEKLVAEERWSQPEVRLFFT